MIETRSSNGDAALFHAEFIIQPKKSHERSLLAWDIVCPDKFVIFTFITFDSTHYLMRNTHLMHLTRFKLPADSLTKTYAQGLKNSTNLV